MLAIAVAFLVSIAQAQTIYTFSSGSLFGTYTATSLSLNTCSKIADLKSIGTYEYAELALVDYYKLTTLANGSISTDFYPDSVCSSLGYYSSLGKVFTLSGLTTNAVYFYSNNRVLFIQTQTCKQSIPLPTLLLQLQKHMAVLFFQLVAKL